MFNTYQCSFDVTPRSDKLMQACLKLRLYISHLDYACSCMLMIFSIMNEWHLRRGTFGKIIKLNTSSYRVHKKTWKVGTCLLYIYDYSYLVGKKHCKKYRDPFVCPKKVPWSRTQFNYVNLYTHKKAEVAKCKC